MSDWLQPTQPQGQYLQGWIVPNERVPVYPDPPPEEGTPGLCFSGCVGRPKLPSMDKSVIAGIMTNMDQLGVQQPEKKCTLCTWSGGATSGVRGRLRQFPQRVSDSFIIKNPFKRWKLVFLVRFSGGCCTLSAFSSKWTAAHDAEPRQALCEWPIPDEDSISKAFSAAWGVHFAALHFFDQFSSMEGLTDVDHGNGSSLSQNFSSILSLSHARDEIDVEAVRLVPAPAST